MRLFLSSYRAGNHPSALVDLFGQGAKVAVVSNARDYKDAIERPVRVKEVLEFLEDLGFQASEFDLRNFFQDNKDLDKALEEYTSVWLMGGNTFILRKALKYSGFDKVLSKKARSGQLAFGGESAGAIVATPSLRGTELGDDPDEEPKGYKKPLIWGGLGLVPFYIVPHYKSDWFGMEADAMVQYFEDHKLSHKKLMDGQAIVINGDKEEFLK